MALSTDDVLTILRFIEESDYEEFQLEFDGTKLLVRKTAGAAHELPDSSAAATAVTAATARDTSHVEARPEAGASSGREREAVPAGLHAIRAPMVGTFYRAPAPGAPPFVDVGSVVAENDVVGILEVMKLMNSIPAGARGRVARICVENGAFVEYDQLLMLLEPSDSPQTTPAGSPLPDRLLARS